MKLLTCIFRARGEAAKAAVAANAQNKSTLPAQATPHPVTQLAKTGSEAGRRPGSEVSNLPSRVDLHILNFIFTEFRQHIIPQTCISRKKAVNMRRNKKEKQPGRKRKDIDVRLLCTDIFNISGSKTVQSSSHADNLNNGNSQQSFSTSGAIIAHRSRAEFWRRSCHQGRCVRIHVLHNRPW